ncbi:GTA-gp10 family protein [Bradyrhizobium diazoefficiens]|uniref:Gene transfer agent family protein n=1 Tax=Bradyrhizobium diazoefficiens TaxID=1355477 RepID=A0A810BEG2_9BRAD|nr:hypothetical protein XF8B_40360 [Bradyrhizobium diazoefficiens]
MTTEATQEISWATPFTFDLHHPWVRRVISWRGINGRPPAAVLTGFVNNTYSPEDVDRVIELGLIGGGMPERDVEALLDGHVRGRPIIPNLTIATAVLASLFAKAT